MCDLICYLFDFAHGTDLISQLFPQAVDVIGPDNDLLVNQSLQSLFLLVQLFQYLVVVLLQRLGKVFELFVCRAVLSVHLQNDQLKQMSTETKI